MTDKVKISFYASKELRKQLNHIAIEKDTKVSVILRDLAAEYVESEKKKE